MPVLCLGDFNKFVADNVRERTSLGSVQASDYLQQQEPDTMSYTVMESEIVVDQEFVEVTEEEADPLDKFLPPPPKVKCSEELQVSRFCICYELLLYAYVAICIYCLELS